MKKWFCFLAVIGLIFSSLLTPSYAHEKNATMIFDTYDYKVSQSRYYNRVSMLKDGKIEYDIIYDKFDNVIKVNGKVVGYVEMDSEQTSNILDTVSTNNYGSMLMVAKNFWNAGNFKHKYKVTIEEASIIVGAIIALPAIIGAATITGISMATMKSAVSALAKNILNAWSAQGILSHYAGKFYVSGYVSFTLQRRNDASSRYANRKLYMKIVLASKKYKSKTRSLGNGGWFKSTRPNY